jgi:hypothetical protein
MSGGESALVADLAAAAGLPLRSLPRAARVKLRIVASAYRRSATDRRAGTDGRARVSRAVVGGPL